MNGKTFISIAKISLIVPALLLISGCFNSDQPEETEYQYETSLKSFNSCQELSSYLQETQALEQTLVDYYYTSGFPEETTDTVIVTTDDWTASAESDLASSLSDGGSGIDTYTSTNNQVAGVDEGDFVKTVGDYTYILNGGYLVIIDSWPADQTHELSRTQLKGSPVAVYVHEDIAWVVSSLSAYGVTEELFALAPRTHLLTEVTLYDISDRELPVLQRQITFEGGYVGARKIGSQVYMVTNTRFDFFALPDLEESIDITAQLPVLNDRRLIGDNYEDTVSAINECNAIYRPETANGTGTVSVINFDLSQPLNEIQRQTILSNSGLIYASQDNLYVASMEDNYWAWLPVIEGFDRPQPGTTFHKFSLAEIPTYVASGRVDGYLINQFAMDEHEGMLRAVTSTSNWWSNESPQNSLYILQQSEGRLQQRSVLTGLGKEDDRLYAVRFQGDQGFVVTFRLIDPLYTLDLSDADNPRVAGELEVPGFSTYLHPIETGLLLAVGRSVTDNSIDLSLFDTSDFSNPALLHRKTIGSGSYSEAEYDHKAFTWDAQNNRLALPVTRWQSDFLPTNYYDYNVFNGLQLYDVNRETGFELFGEIDHSDLYINDTSQYYYFPQVINRSFFVSDTEQNSFLYSISGRGLKVNAMTEQLDELAALPLPGYDWEHILVTD